MSNILGWVWSEGKAQAGKSQPRPKVTASERSIVIAEVLLGVFFQLVFVDQLGVLLATGVAVNHAGGGFTTNDAHRGTLDLRRLAPLLKLY